MPKLFQYKCEGCGTVHDEMFNVSELVDGHVSPDYLPLECPKCKVVTIHDRMEFASNPHRTYVNDGGKLVG